MRPDFRTWKRNWGLNCHKAFKAELKSSGMVGSYPAFLASGVGFVWSECPAKLQIIEQVIWVRHRDQHPKSIASVRGTHAEMDRQRCPRSFFMSECKTAMFGQGDEPALFMSPSIHVARDKVMTAIEQVERFCKWLEEKMIDAKDSARIPCD